MKLCDLTLPTPEENLACDEALLDLCEAGGSEELLRLWAPPAILRGPGLRQQSRDRSQPPLLPEPRHPRAAPLHRRRDGPARAGRAQLLARSCASTTPARATASPPPTSSFSSATATLLAALLCAPVEWRGQTDLAIGGLKFSGNAQRRRRRFLLFHGSFLLHLDLGLVEQALPLPSRQPDYRVNRSHADFLINLNVPAPTIKRRPDQGLERHRAARPNPPRPDHPPGPREILPRRVELPVLAARPPRPALYPNRWTLAFPPSHFSVSVCRPPNNPEGIV